MCSLHLCFAAATKSSVAKVSYLWLYISEKIKLVIHDRSELSWTRTLSWHRPTIWRYTAAMWPLRFIAIN